MSVYIGAAREPAVSAPLCAENITGRKEKQIKKLEADLERDTNKYNEQKNEADKIAADIKAYNADLITANEERIRVIAELKRLEELKDARIHPENHGDLIVRVAGYSDYFVNLTPELQDEVISRKEHSFC